MKCKACKGDSVGTCRFCKQGACAEHMAYTLRDWRDDDYTFHVCRKCLAEYIRCERSLEQVMKEAREARSG